MVLTVIALLIALAVFCVKEGRSQLEYMQEGTKLYDNDPEGLFEGPTVSALGTPGEITVEVAYDEKRRTRNFKMGNFMTDQKLYL